MQLFKIAEFAPYAGRWNRRQQVFNERDAYYSGAVYMREKMRFGYFLGSRLYRGIKPLHLPFARAVNVDAGITPGGWRFAEDAPDVWSAARRQVWSWSDWTTKGVLFVHWGAVFGMSGIRVSDLRDQRRVIMSPVDPRRFMLIGSSEYDQTPKMAIYIDQRKDGDGKPFEYAEVVTADAIRTFKDDQPVGFGGRPAEYQNALGFVPFTEVKHIEDGDPIGANTFKDGMRILDELNQLGSYLADLIKKHADPQWIITNAESGDLKRGDNVWYVPGENADVKALLAALDIDGVRGFIGDLRDNVHATLPELAFDELKSKDQIATATIELQLQELVIKVKRTRPNYDSGMVDGLQMAGRAAESLDLADVAPLNDENLALDNDRPVLRAELETRERADYLIKTGAPSEAVWTVLGYDKDQIAEWNRIKAEHAATFNRQIDSDGETEL